MGKGDRLDDQRREVRQVLARGAKPKGRKALFIAHCLELGIEIQARKVAEGLTINQACSRERELIAHYGRREFGGCLLNLDSGGNGSKNTSPSTAAKLSAALRGKKRGKPSKETLAKRAEALRRDPFLSERRAKAFALASARSCKGWERRKALQTLLAKLGISHIYGTTKDLI
jgi:hypothetical protein